MNERPSGRIISNVRRSALSGVVVSLLAACGGSTNAGADGAKQGDAAVSETGVIEAGEASSGEAGGGGGDAGDSGNTDGGGSCTLTANTTPTGTTNNGCALVTRDTSACQASRTSAGLTGFWSKFSCRVTLTAASGGATTVTVASDGQPDHESNYFPTTDPCYAAYSPVALDPNHIAVHALSLTVPLAPTSGSQTMGLGPVGMALDGSAIFDNQAAPGDDIYAEAASFDRCQGHPSPASQYHYHTEPYAISHDDDAFIGVMRDGYPIYGRRDVDGTLPANLDASGGHTGTTPDSPSTAVYHYHTNLQTSHTGATSGDTDWFLATGTYAGPPGSCTGC